MTAAVEGLVTRAQSGFYHVECNNGEQLVAVLRGRLKRERQRHGLVVLGDRVRVERLVQPEGEAGKVDAVIIERLERERALVRRAPGPRGAWAQDVVVANIDQLVTTFAVMHPEPSLRMLDRLLALCEIDEIDALIVFNKVELGMDDALSAAIDEYTTIGYPVLRTSVETGEGIGALRAALAGRVSALVGPSGVGKSSLLNAVAPGLELRVGDVSEAVDKGRHTTRVAELHRLPGVEGGRVADTPGLREIALWEVDPADVEWGFVEFRPYLNECRFGNCTHVHEPGCAVRNAVKAGQISGARYESYLRLLEQE